MTGPGAAFLDVSDGAAVVEYPGLSDEESNRAAVALAGGLQSPRIAGLLDAIAGARTLWLVFDPLVLAHEAIRREVFSRAAQSAPADSGRTVSIGVHYGGEMGPDLPEVAARAGLSLEDFARRHAAVDYRVAFLGFAPGFAYLTGLDPALCAPRLSTPRPRVPAGSVAIGGTYTGIYPSATPGGWRLIGRSAVRLFDEEADSPALLRAGDHVRFEPLAAANLGALERELEANPSRRPSAAGGRPVLRVLRPGVFTSVQGAPQFHRGASGLPPGGAMDSTALSRGNARLANAEQARALEMTFLGPEMEVLSEIGICVSGAAMAVERNGASIAAGYPVRVASGDRLRFGPARDGKARAYLCVEGGLQSPGRLGLTRRLEAGDVLTAEPARRASGEPEVAPARTSSGGPKDLVLRVVLDPRRERFFKSAAVEQFLSSTFRVSSTSDRRGIRLEGSPVTAESPEMPPEGTALGTIQVPADGQPILLGPDRPITGGYARVGTVIAPDWSRIAQAPPGRTVRFTAMTLAQALAARAAAGSEE